MDEVVRARWRALSGDPVRRTMHGALEDAAALGATVTFTDGETFDATDLVRRARRTGAALRAAGASPGDRVAICSSNRVEFLDVWFGCSLAGLVAVPLNTALFGSILEHMLDLTKPSVLVAEAPFLDQIDDAASRVAGMESSVRFAFGGDDTPAPWRPLLPAVETAGELSDSTAVSSDVAAIMFTSGTTGPSKGVVYAHNTGHTMADAAVRIMDYRESDVLYTCLPLYHGNALFVTLLAGLRAGASIVIAPRFSASRFWSDVRTHEVTMVNILGSMAPILWGSEAGPDDREHRVRRALVVPSLPNQREFEARFGVEIAGCYGITDANIILGTEPGSRREGSCGRAMPWWDWAVVDDSDNPVGTNEVGELIVRPLVPFSLPIGYLGMPEETLASYRNLWFHTGDYVRVDDDGWFEFVDRKKDAIRRFGENISAFEVEQVLLLHPNVIEVAVFAVPSELSEDEVMAAVVLDDPNVSYESLVEFCAERLPYFAVPRYLERLDALPKTRTEKVVKADLRARGVSASTFDRGPVGRSAKRHAAATTPGENA